LKGYYEKNWTEVYNAGGMPTPSDSEYTVIEFNSEGGYYTFVSETTSLILEVTPNGQVDFQVQALIGYAHRAIISGLYVPWVFEGERSGWSETQTMTIP
jgi:hypothetical protein